MKDMVKIDQERLRAQLEKKLPPKVRLFQLDDIPGVMRSRMGWPVAAALMERWFRGAAFEMTDEIKLSQGPKRLSRLLPAQLDENTATMAWALGFARVRAAMSKLQAQWASPGAFELLKQRVNAQAMVNVSGPWRFGDLAQPAKVLDDVCQVNYLKFGRFSDPLDDFYGAMGEATLKVAVSGLVVPKGARKASIAIDELGFYLRDAYDFNDAERAFLSQPLGFWGFRGVQRLQWGGGVPISERWVNQEKARVLEHAYWVQNEDFRKWRAKNGRGGDFMVLSDVHRMRLPFPIMLEW